MRPRGMPSRWVKVLPWYYTERNQPSRAAERKAAMAAEFAATGDEPHREQEV